MVEVRAPDEASTPGACSLTRCHSSALQETDAQHPLLVDLAEKSDLFDKAATKYKAKVAA